VEVGTTLEFFYWLRFAALAGLLALTLMRARRRWLNAAEGDQARRILLPWAVVIFGFSIYLGLLTVLVAPLAIFWVVAIVALWVAVPAVASIAVLDIGARLMQAERTGFWLGAAIVAYVAVTFLWLGLLGIGPLLLVPGLWLEFLGIASVPVSAAFVWWSYLPGGGGGGGIAEAFE
jgi:hypothetical protein